MNADWTYQWNNSPAGSDDTTFIFLKQPHNTVGCPLSCHQTPECCLVVCECCLMFRDVCDGTWLCVWTVQAGSLNCSVPLKFIQNHLDPLSAGTVGDLSLSVFLFQSGRLSLLLCCVVSLLIFPASLNYLVSLSFSCEGDVYVGVRVHLLSGGGINITLTNMHVYCKHLTLISDFNWEKNVLL